MIEPAMTPKEWAWVDANPLVVQFPERDFTLDVPAEADEMAAMAALCLYGRITWEMVDVIEAASRTLGDNDLQLIADLLKSMLPPR